MLSRFKNKLAKLCLFFKKEAPLETTARQELLERIDAIKDTPPSTREVAWEKYRLQLRQYLSKGDLRNFLRWDPILSSMFNNAHKNEFEYLVRDNKWLPLLEETWHGNPQKYKYYKKTSGNLVHTAYNLDQLINKTKINLANVQTILEFGGGYGCMANLIQKMGFSGAYSIFDIPEFLALQKYYLQLNGADMQVKFFDSVDSINVVSPDIFIATWSLSEAPIELRDSLLQKIGRPHYVLIAYQQNFCGIDNVKYFGKYIESNNDYIWANSLIEHLPGNYYLIGIKK